MGERRRHLEGLFAEGVAPDRLADAFLEEPLFQRGYSDGFGTLFTADYAPGEGAVTLRWPGQAWHQRLDAFAEGRREIGYAAGGVPAVSAPADFHGGLAALRPYLSETGGARFDRWIAEARQGRVDWSGLGAVFAH